MSERSSARTAQAVFGGAFALLILTLTPRGWVLSRGYFYWDDFILVGRAAAYPLFSVELLLHDHDGHFMPGAFALAWLTTAVAPLQWWAAAMTLLVLQVAAGGAVLRLLIVLMGRRPAVLVPFAFYLLTPLTLPAFAWWAAGLNALPLQAALAWVTADAIKLVRTRQRRFALSGLAVFLVGLLFFEKAVVVPFVAGAGAVLLLYVTGISRPIQTVLREAKELWIGSALLLLWWLPAYVSVVRREVSTEGVDAAATILNRTFTDSFVPALVGGPWSWERWLPSTPWAAPPQALMIAAWLILAAVVVAVLVHKRRALPVLLFVVLYVVVATIPVLLLRTGPDTAPELVQSLRYLAETSVIVVLAIALVYLAPPRSRRGGKRSMVSTHAPVGGAVLVGVSSVLSTVTFADAWSDSPAREYFTNIHASTTPGAPVTLLDQEVPWLVLSPLTYPNNLASQVLAPLDDRVRFAPVVDDLRMISDNGEIIAGDVWWNRGIVAGPEPECGYRLTAARAYSVPLDGAMYEHGWTAQLNYFASGPGEMTVAFESPSGLRAPVTVPLKEGLNTAYTRLVGGGDALAVEVMTPGVEVCLGSGPVGVASHSGN